MKFEYVHDLDHFRLLSLDEPYEQEDLNYFARIDLHQLCEDFVNVEEVSKLLDWDGDNIMIEQYCKVPENPLVMRCVHCMYKFQEFSVVYTSVRNIKAEDFVNKFRDKTEFCFNCTRALFCLMDTNKGITIELDLNFKN